MTHGTLISIEGIDGAGKSSVIYGDYDHKGLRDWFEDPVITSEPQEEQWLGGVLRQALKGEVGDMALFFLFLAGHAQHVSDYIEPALDDGSLIITDRYIDSRYAYQAPTVANHINGDYENGEAFQWIKSIQEAGWSRQPDYTIILDLPVETALERLSDRPDGTDEEVFEKREKLEAAREMYLTLADRFDHYTVVNATRDIDVVAAECAGIIENVHRQ